MIFQHKTTHFSYLFIDEEFKLKIKLKKLIFLI